MHLLSKLITGFSLFLILSYHAYGNTDKYRLSLRSDPSTSIVIGWNQISGSNPIVYYGTVDHGTNWSAYPSNKSVDRSVSYRGMDNRFVRLTGLEPNTAYYFVIRDNEGTSQRFWFKTAPNTNTERLSFIAGGDSRNNRTPRINANKLVAKLRPHAVLFGGDMTDNDTDGQWKNWFNDWQYTIGNDGRMIPIIAARGNHERSNNTIYNLFDVPSTKVYYGLTFGDNLIRTYTLNTEISISGDQTTWLRNDLNSNSNTIWKMAQYHKPMRPHVSSKPEGNGQYNNWAGLFYDKGIKLVVECDAHTVKSTWPLRPTSGNGSQQGFIRDNENGTVYVGEGCWGAPLRSNNDNKNWTRNSGRFNQFKWIFVDRNSIETRTIKVDNADAVGQVSDNNIFLPPANLDIWNPSNGAVVTITNQSAPDVTITAPANGTSYDAPQPININAQASDKDGTIAKVEFYVNGSKVGTDSSAPYTTSYTPSGNGTFTLSAKAFDNEGLTRASPIVNIYVGTVSVNTSSRINSGNDDVEENTLGGMYMNSSDLELVRDGWFRGDQTIGLRFKNLKIPQGAKINSAYIQFTVDETSNDNTNLTIYGEDSDNAPTFVNNNYNVSSRNKTSAARTWSPSSWNSKGAAGAQQRTPDLTQIVQEIVNRSGWSSNSALGIIIKGSGKRTAEAYEGSPASAPIIYVNYSIGSNEPPKPTLVSKRIQNGNDDVEENENGSMYMNSSDLEMVKDGRRGNQKVGMRFTGMNIPKGATITNAYIQFVVDETNSGATSLNIKGFSHDNCPAFASTNYNVSSRSTTGSNVAWNPASWNREGEAGSRQRTPNLKTIIQEIVNRSGWSPGNALGITITGTGERAAEAFEGDANNAPILFVEYSAAGNSRQQITVSTPQKIATEKLPETKVSTNTWDVKVYPNPARASVNIKIATKQASGEVKGQMYTHTGSVMKTLKLTTNKSNTIDLNGLKEGTYFIRIEIAPKKYVVRKIIKE